MNRVIALILSLLVAVPAFADFPAVRNDSAATTIAPTNGLASLLSVDSKGKLYVISADPYGNTEAIIPVSNSAGLNGPLASVNGYYNVGTDTIEAASTTTVLVLTAHVARVGDLIYPTAGTAGNIGVQIPVCSVATNSVTLDCKALSPSGYRD